MAALVLLGLGAPFAPNLPYHYKNAGDMGEGQQGAFVGFGAPHVLGLLAELASRALKAACFQKLHVLRRIRPEAVGILVERCA